MATTGRTVTLNGPKRTLRQHARVLYVTAHAEYKLKYSGSALGYVWSVLKPLGLFTMLYLVFGNIFKLGTISPYYGLSLLIGIVCWTFFADATSMAMGSLVARESLLRKLSFPRLIIPTSSTLSAAMTFLVNCVVVMVFVTWKQITPRPDWILIIPLLAELYIYTLGVALILSTLFVRLRDIGQVWDLLLQFLFYAAPIVYPIGYLPALPPEDRLPQPVHAGSPGHSLDHPLPRYPIESHHRRGRIWISRCSVDTDFDRVRHLLHRPRVVQARGALVCGARLEGMDGDPIQVLGVTKTFRLPHQQRNTLKEHFLHPFTKTTYEYQAALADISFEVSHGEFFGIIGPNGSGKSTLLKILAGVYRQNSGEVHIHGLLSPFIELGVGFNPELSARDNIRINGSLLGLSARQLAERYDEIVAFSELERFMDQKLKNFSSGMLVRLAYSIAIQVDFDILLLDEVLAVGDLSFQDNCFVTFHRFRAEKKTIVLVTHNLSVLDDYADRVLLLESGRISKIGSAADVIARYKNEAPELVWAHAGNHARIHSVRQRAIETRERHARHRTSVLATAATASANSGIEIRSSNRSATRAEAACPSAAAWLGLASRELIPAAIAPGVTSTSSPESPSTIASRLPSTAVATIGRAQAIASSSAWAKPSVLEERRRRRGRGSRRRAPTARRTPLARAVR